MSENLLENGKYGKNHEKSIQIKYKHKKEVILLEHSRVKKYIHYTKNTDKIYIYHSDISILREEKNGKRKCIRHTSSYVRYSYLTMRLAVLFMLFVNALILLIKYFYYFLKIILNHK